MKRCYLCDTVKPARDFYPSRRGGRDTRHSGCKDCRREQARQHSKRTYQPRRKATA